MTLRRQLRLLTFLSYLTLALTALGLAFLMMSEAQALGIQPWTAGDWWTFLLPDGQNTGFTFMFIGMMQAIFLYLRRKTAWRLAALAGKAEAMPLALPELVVGEHGGEVAAAPVKLQWRLTKYGRTIWLLPWGLLGVFIMAGGGALLATQIAYISPGLAPSDPSNVAHYAAASAFILAGLAVLVMAVLQGLRGSAGVSADSAGISQWTRRGPGETIIWSDARLIEANWIAGARGQSWPYIRVYRADGTSIGWPVFPAPQPEDTWRYEVLEMSESEAAKATLALLNLASARSGLPVHTAERSLADPAYKRGQWLLGAGQSLAVYLYTILIMAALGISILVFYGVGAPWLNVAAAVGLGLCAARLAYFYVGDALVMPDSWETKSGNRPRGTLVWPALLAVSGAGALVASVSALIAGSSPAWGWTDAEVIGGSAIMFLGGALIFWVRTPSREYANDTSMQA